MTIEKNVYLKLGSVGLGHTWPAPPPTLIIWDYVRLHVDNITTPSNVVFWFKLNKIDIFSCLGGGGFVRSSRISSYFLSIFFTVPATWRSEESTCSNRCRVGVQRGTVTVPWKNVRKVTVCVTSGRVATMATASAPTVVTFASVIEAFQVGGSTSFLKNIRQCLEPYLRSFSYFENDTFEWVLN